MVVLLFVAVIFSVIADFKPKNLLRERDREPEQEPEPETALSDSPEPEPEPEPEPDQQLLESDIQLPGYVYNRYKGKWVQGKKKPEVELTPNSI